MEGPSLVILKKELRPFLGQKVQKITGNSKQPIIKLHRCTLAAIETWGKALFLTFQSPKKTAPPILTKTHFMMFGSYRINDPKVGRDPRVELRFKNGILYLYACSFQMDAAEYYAHLDFKVDVMAKTWDPEYVLQQMEKKKDAYLCDLFLDQTVFAGSGNIVKNEVLFNLRCHPLTKLSQVPRRDWPKLIMAIHDYCWSFYSWKKKYEFRRHWQVYRQHHCPLCKSKLVKESDGKMNRKSFFCPVHQKGLRARAKLDHLQVCAVLPIQKPKGREAPLDH
jgi:endonuclease-8